MASGGARPGAGAPKGKPQRRQRLLSHEERLRARINSGKLLARLDKLAHGQINDEAPQLQVQARAAEILLRKTLPDLTRAELTGADGGPLEIVTRAE